MKMKTITKAVTVLQYKPFYVADDGTEFMRRSDCEFYEAQQVEKNRKILNKDTRTVDTERPAKLWYIRNKEDFDWLRKKKWIHADIRGHKGFIGPGWYISIWNDGGDSIDYYEVYHVDEYLHDYEKQIQEIRHLTSEEI